MKYRGKNVKNRVPVVQTYHPALNKLSRKESSRKIRKKLKTFKAVHYFSRTPFSWLSETKKSQRSVRQSWVDSKIGLITNRLLSKQAMTCRQMLQTSFHWLSIYHIPLAQYIPYFTGSTYTKFYWLSIYHILQHKLKNNKQYT